MYFLCGPGYTLAMKDSPDDNQQRQQETVNPLGIPGLKKLVVMPGRSIFEQGTPAHQAFYIESGRVEVRISEGAHTIKVAEIGPGEIFGEMGVLDNRLRIATVTTIEQSTIAVITRKELEERIANIADPVVKSMIAALVKRLSAANAAQMQHYKTLALFQDRMAGLIAGVNTGIPQEKRDEFTAEVMPVLDRLEDVMKKYRPPGQ